MSTTSLAVLVALGVAAAVVVVLATPTPLGDGGGVEGMTTSIPACHLRCKWAMKEFAATMKLKRAPGSTFDLLLPEDRCGSRCDMSFSVGGTGRRHARATRLPDGSVRLLAYNLNGDRQFNKTECATYADCVGAWGRMLGVYHDKAGPAVTPGAAAELKADSAARQFTEVQVPPPSTRSPLDLSAVRGTLVRGIENSSAVDKARIVADLIAVRPRKGSAIAAKFDWAAVDRVYLVQANRSAPASKSLERWTAARRAAGKSATPEEFSRYMIHAELFQLMQMQAYLVDAGELLLGVLPQVSKMPAGSRTRLAAAVSGMASKPGGPAIVHHADNAAPFGGVSNGRGIGIKLACSNKLIDDANSTSLHGSCGSKPLVSTLLHEYAHLLASVSKDEFVKSHNYGFWAFYRFLQLILVEAGLLNHNWRLNAKNYSAASYGGYDPYFQRDWGEIRREVLRVGGRKADTAAGGAKIGDSLGGADPVSGTHWDDVWAGVQGELADAAIMARLKKLAED